MSEVKTKEQEEGEKIGVSFGNSFVGHFWGNRLQCVWNIILGLVLFAIIIRPDFFIAKTKISPSDKYELWDLAGITLSIFLSGLYYCDLFKKEKREKLSSLSSGLAVGFAFLSVVALGFAWCGAIDPPWISNWAEQKTSWIAKDPCCKLMLLSLIVATFLYLLVDIIILKNYRPYVDKLQKDIESVKLKLINANDILTITGDKNEKKVTQAKIIQLEENYDAKKEAMRNPNNVYRTTKTSLLFGNLPATLGFCFIFIFLILSDPTETVHAAPPTTDTEANNNKPENDKTINKGFVSGSTAMQLIYGNIIVGFGLGRPSIFGLGRSKKKKKDAL